MDALEFVALRLARKLHKDVNWYDCKRALDTGRFVVTNKGNSVKVEIEYDTVVAQANLENPAW